MDWKMQKHKDNSSQQFYLKFQCNPIKISIGFQRDINKPILKYV